MSEPAPGGEDLVCPVGASAVLPAGEVLRDAPPANVVPGFEILGRLGEGGMGTVWRAIQKSTGRQVALKTISISAFGTRKAAERFTREIRLAATLEHPHVARVYDGGIDAQVLYCAMELVDGRPIDAHAEGSSLGPRAIARLMVVVCDAVGYLHGRGIIHRDIKPSNILVDAAGNPRILDFGLAKELGLESGCSVRGEIAGTIDYMSPEQARGDSAAVDTRSDVYALGMLMYRLLTGGLPRDLSGSSLAVLTRISELDLPPPRSRRRDLDRDLDAIVTRAVSREPADRYFNAALLAEDLNRYLAGRPVSARRQSAGYVARRFVMRNRVAIGVTFLVLAAIITSTWASFRRVNVALESEEQRRVLAERRLARSLIAEGDAFGLASRWVEARERYHRAYEVTASLGDSTLAADAAMTEALGEAPPPLVRLIGHRAPVAALGFIGGSAGAVSLDTSGQAIVWDVPRGRAVRRFQVASRVACAAISADGRRLFVAGDLRGAVWDVATGTRVGELQLEEVLAVAAMSADGTMIAFGGAAGRVSLWNGQTGAALKHLRRLTAHISAIAFSPDGRRLIAGASEHDVSLYDLSTDEARAYTVLDKAVRCAGFTPDGRQALVGGADNRIGVIQCDDVSGGRTYVFHTSALVAFGTIGEGVFSLSGDGQAVFFRPGEDWRHGALSLSTYVTRAASGPGGEVMVTGDDGAIDVFTLDVAAEVGRLGGDVMPRCIAMTSDGRLVATAHTDGEVRLRDRITRRHLRTWRLDPGSSASALAFSSDFTELYVGAGNGRVIALDLLGTARREFSGLSDVRAVAGSDDGRFVIGISGVAAARWDRNGNGSAPLIIRAPRTLAWGMRVSSDGDRVIAFSESGSQACRFDFRETTARLVPPVRRQMAGGPAISPDGRAAVAFGGHAVSTFRIDGENGSEKTGVGHTHQVRSLACSADGALLLTASLDKTVGLWDWNRGELIRRIHGAQSGLTWVATGHSGRIFVTGDDAARVRGWDLSRPEIYRQAEAHVRPAQAALGSGRDDARSLRVVGEWYAFRNRWAWAVEMLQEAERRGEPVDQALLARSLWLLSDKQAIPRLKTAIEAERRPAELTYLMVWLAAIQDSVGN